MSISRQTTDLNIQVMNALSFCLAMKMHVKVSELVEMRRKCYASAKRQANIAAKGNR